MELSALSPPVIRSASVPGSVSGRFPLLPENAWYAVEHSACLKEGPRPLSFANGPFVLWRDGLGGSPLRFPAGRRRPFVSRDRRRFHQRWSPE